MALADKLEQLPARPGVYLFKDKTGAIVYVGKARVLRDRVRSYFQAWRPAEQHKTSLAEEIADLELIVTDSEMEALALENNLIKRHKPLLQRAAARRQEPPLPEADTGRGVPAALRGAAAGRGRQRLRRPVHPGEHGPPDRRTRPASSSGSARARRR